MIFKNAVFIFGYPPSGCYGNGHTTKWMELQLSYYIYIYIYITVFSQQRQLRNESLQSTPQLNQGLVMVLFSL